MGALGSEAAAREENELLNNRKRTNPDVSALGNS
jgi:hypothetical protein